MAPIWAGPGLFTFSLISIVQVNEHYVTASTNRSLITLLDGVNCIMGLLPGKAPIDRSSFCLQGEIRRPVRERFPLRLSTR